MPEKDGSGIPHFILREISSLKDLKGCPNIVQLLDIFEVRGSRKIILSFKFEKGGDLNKLLYKQAKYFSSYAKQHPLPKEGLKGLPINLVIKFSRDLLNGVKAVHTKGWIHRDLKPGNLMISEKFTENWFKACLSS